MNVKNFIIHRLEKEAHKPATLTKRQDASDVNARVTTFSTEIRSAYRSSGVKFGSFDENTVTYPFQTLVKNYLAGRQDFVALTHSAAEHLKKLADQKSASKGGYLVFSHYTDDADHEFLSVMVLNDKSGHAVDHKTLDLIESIHLQIDKVHVASALNISRWNANEEPYLSFVEGSRDLSGYFLDFIGCTTLTNSTQQSRALSAAVKDYLNAAKLEDKVFDSKLSQVFDYCQTQVGQDQPIHLSAIAALIAPENPRGFVEFARKSEYCVDESFHGNMRSLKSMTRVAYSGSDLRISFDHSQITEGRIVYDEKKNSLTIKQVPEGLRKQLSPDVA